MPPQHLDEKIKIIWFLPTAATLLLIWIILSGVMFFALGEQEVMGMHKQLFSVLLFFFIALFLAGPIYAYTHLEYISFTYEMTEREFVIRQGIITRHTSVIPYNRIQNVNSTRTLIERFLGLATLQIETAGTNPSASEGLLPGISKKDSLIAEIMQNVEHFKKLQAAPNGAVAKTERQILGEILLELVQIKHNLQQLNTREPKGEMTLVPPSINWRNIRPGHSGVNKGK